MKLAAVVFFFVFSVSSCKFNPTQLADDYCSCLQQMERGKSTTDDCREMAESHNLKLQDDDEAMKKYTQHITECLMYDDIRTNKDLREDRKDRRNKQQ
ncbi:MAG: hypothetical protein ACHQF2_08590 [Flavobacteriales bacterium]